ncbi:MAG: hypothetical protein JJ895_08140 [Balneolaceae bacterium]|nr:hypothetical protein [Balneolaceae bacterium]
MSKGAIVKIAGFLVVPILIMLVAVYLLYPMINSERYDLIVRTNGTLVDSLALDSLARVDSIATADSLSRLEKLTSAEYAFSLDRKWSSKVDSLERMVYLLSARLEGMQNASEVNEQNSQEAPAQSAPVKEPTIDELLSDEAFKDRVKSLLNLEEDELSPILEKMTSKQLVRLYSEAGNTQREKILRALNSDRAAKLITEVML